LRGNGLYQALVKPVPAHIPAGVREIVIVPDGILAHLPFDLLRENRNSPEDFWYDREKTAADPDRRNALTVDEAALSRGLAGVIRAEDAGAYYRERNFSRRDLDARMVALSAYQTGLGRVVRRGDGMVGLARSFLTAGAEKVGVSLRAVNDEATAEFMTRLYGKVVEGAWTSGTPITR
jgi:CHAT domain-containing protein